jgi:hypothetical protein
MVPPKKITITHYHRHWDESDMGISPLEWTVLGTVFAVIWLLYWLIIHWVDHFVGDWLAWYVELLTPFLAVPCLWVFNRYGRNPLHWWPMVWGHPVKLDRNNADLVLMDESAVVQVMGGPMRVWCDVRDPGDVYLKFRRRRDAVWFGLFPYFKTNRKRKKR